MGLEPYEGRYTLQLQDWSTAVYDRRGIDYVVVPGETIDNTKSFKPENPSTIAIMGLDAVFKTGKTFVLNILPISLNPF